MSKIQRTITQIILVVVVLAGAIVAMKVLMSLRKPPAKQERVAVFPLLNAVLVGPESVQMTVSGYGTVEPRSDVQVVPQVSGRVVQCHSQWVDGGFFEAGEPLVVIEDSDYQLAVQSAEAMVAQVTVALEQENAEAEIARTEWKKLNPDSDPDRDAPPLVLREPQIKNARAQRKAAEAQLEKAKLDLKRTTITMPFDGRIVSAMVDIGQFVTSGSPIATVYRTDLVEVAVPMEDAELEWFNVPLSMNDGRSEQYNSSSAVLHYEFAGKKYSRQGSVVRTEGKIDERSRMVSVVVQIDDPFKTDGGAPLVPGMFVRVDIMGKKMDNIFRVPRYAMHGRDDQVWVGSVIPESNEVTPIEAVTDGEDNTESEDESASQVSADSNETPASEVPWQTRMLQIAPVKAIRLDKEYAYISEGLRDGDVIVTSPLETVTDGMHIRVIVDRDNKQEEQ